MRYLCTALLIFCSLDLMAQQRSFYDYVKELRQEAMAKGISQATIDSAFKEVKLFKRAIRHDKHQANTKLTLDTYLPAKVPDWKIAKARALYKENKALLNKVGASYGVQPRFILALWGIETDFGKQSGGYPIISVIISLAYDGSREAFFKKELFAALQLVEDGVLPLNSLTGSWTGAMGKNLLMPSYYREYAQDFDGDGRKDIWHSKADIFATIANYLKQAGWNEQLTWGRQVKLPADFDIQLAGLATAKTLPQWQALGVRRYSGSNLPNVDIKASVIMPDDDLGRVFLAYENYHALMKWRDSLYFVSAVGYLSDRIKYPPIN